MTTREHQDADPVVEVSSGEPEISDDPEEIRQQISQTRAELGETVEALASKADVKAQVKEKVATAKEQAQGKAAAVKSRPLPAVLAAGGLFLTWMIRRRRRAR